MPSPHARISSELNQADPAAVVDLASACLEDDPDLEITRAPRTGVLVTQARDTVAEQRFILGDVMVTQAEVRRRGAHGWAARLGSDRTTTLAAALLAAEHAADGPRRREIDQLVESTASRRAADRAAEWERLAPTIVEFEEVL